MKKLIYLISLSLFICTSCDNPKKDGEKLGKKTCDCLNIKDEAEIKKCKNENDIETNKIKEKYKDSPAKMFEFISAYSKQTIKCIGELTKTSFDQYQNTMGEVGVQLPQHEIEKAKQAVDNATNSIGGGVKLCSQQIYFQEKLGEIYF